MDTQATIEEPVTLSRAERRRNYNKNRKAAKKINAGPSGERHQTGLTRHQRQMLSSNRDSAEKRSLVKAIADYMERQKTIVGEMAKKRAEEAEKEKEQEIKQDA